MEHRFGRRYMVRKQIHTLPHGDLYEAVDHSLQRTVLVYEINPEQNGEAQSTHSNLLRATRFSHERFMHILDIGSEQDVSFAVLKAVSGTPLIQQVKRHTLSSWNILNAVAELGKAMQDAAEEGFYGYSVCADNVWLAFGRQLMPIHYWDEASDKQKGATGLCSLLFQLAARTDALPSDSGELEQRLRFALRDLPSHQLEALLSLCVRTFREHLSLNSFLQELQACLEERKAFTAPSSPLPRTAPVTPPVRLEDTRLEHRTDEPIAAVPAAKQAPAPAPQRAPKPAPKPAAAAKHREEPPQNEEEEEDLLPTSGRWWKKLAIITGSACLFVVLLVTFLTIIMQTGIHSGSHPDQAKSAAPTAPADSAKANPDPAPASSSDNAVKPDAQQQTAPGDPSSIPQLVGLTQADAEKSAIAAGLHYKFFLESNDAPKGTVFKQDPNAGDPASKGGTITFWISKGK